MVPAAPARLSRRWLAAALLALLVAGCASETGRRTVSRGAAVARSKPTPGETYVVARGDTLYSIAFRNGLDYRELADWNGIGRDYTIRPGQRLQLGPPGAATPAAPVGAGIDPPLAPSSSAVATASSEPIPIVTGTASWEWPTRGELARSFATSGSKGIDIAGEAGQLVIAARGGKVVYSGAALKGYGELVIIKHDEQYLSAYGYNRRRLVEEGETVGPGQPIAELGLGPENRPLLHFEVRDRGRPIDPVPLLPRR
ncbi:MAG: peptidoglycan DD-metalloendopeptidase family protein [Gammaproteobacteria bacterium]|nr:peptidoglycan DD-metalloendopeptidase family protein [Gammaproteobacteria bacterium]